MQNSKLSIAIFVFVGILLVGVFYLLNRNNTNHDWNETYEEASEEPYGSHVIYELLQSYFEGADFHEIEYNIADELPIDSTIQNANFVFIGQAILLDSLAVERLVQFAENGNHLFFATKTIPNNLMQEFYDNPCVVEGAFTWTDYDSRRDTIIHLNLINPNLQADSNIIYSSLLKNKATRYNWHYIDDRLFCEYDTTETGITSLGLIDNNYVNFARLSKGKGHLFLHTNPIVFTNVQLLEKEGLAYTSKVFSHLQPGDIYWCSAGRTNEWLGRAHNRNHSNSDMPERDSPLKYILSQPSLAWAWYLTLGLGILFIGFKAKREQRIIPILPKNKNTSLEFISTIGKLHFIQNNHRNLCKEKMKLFLADIRDKYNIPTKDLNEAFVKRLAAKAEVPEALLSKLLLYDKNIKSSEIVTEKTMVEFHQLIEKFYTLKK